MPRFLSMLALCLALLPATARADWVFFDLGDVILAGTPKAGYTYVPGVVDELRQLHEAGFQLGLITNTPESWGATCGAKFSFLQQFIASHLKDPEAFPWPLFSAVVQPPYDRYRKPQSLMFLNGLAQACPARAIYISNKAPEVSKAQSLGYATLLRETPPKALSPWPDAAAVSRLLEAQFTFVYPSACDLQALIAANLLEQDKGKSVQICTHVLP